MRLELLKNVPCLVLKGTPSRRSCSVASTLSGNHFPAASDSQAQVPRTLLLEASLRLAGMCLHLSSSPLPGLSSLPGSPLVCRVREALA